MEYAAHATTSCSGTEARKRGRPPRFPKAEYTEVRAKLPRPLLAQVDAAATESDLDRADIVRAALRSYLTERKQ